MSMTDGNASDLDQLRGAFVPRNEALCRRLSHVVVPTGSIVGSALFWVWAGTVLASLPALLAGFVAYHVVPPEADGSRPLAAIAGFAGLFVGLFAVWLQFGRWVSRRRSAARALFRDGTFVQATVTGLKPINGRYGVVGTSVLATFAAERDTLRAAFMVRPAVKALGPLPLIYVPDYKFAAVFPLDGRAVVARVGKV